MSRLLMRRTLDVLLVLRAQTNSSYLRNLALTSPSLTPRDPHKRSLLAEPRPDYELEGSGPAAEGEWLVRPSRGELIEVEEMRDPETWAHVERLLRKKAVPPIPKHASYPTPSGWFPPTDKAKEYPYTVERTKYHNFPIKLTYENVGLDAMTLIFKIEGDIWQFEADLRAHLEEVTGNLPDWPIITQVDEISRSVRVRGKFLEEVSSFLTERGM